LGSNVVKLILNSLLSGSVNSADSSFLVNKFTIFYNYFNLIQGNISVLKNKNKKITLPNILKNITSINPYKSSEYGNLRIIKQH
jgi:hypothetical protein